jgi:hypothetical protein
LGEIWLRFGPFSALVGFSPIVFSFSLRVFRLAAEKMQEKLKKKNQLLLGLNFDKQD